MTIVLTNTVNSADGFGENFKMLILSMFFAEKENAQFAYLPFGQLCHSNNDKYFEKKMENMINLQKYVNSIDLLLSKTDKHEYSFAHVMKMDLLHFYDNNIEMFMNSNTLKTIKKAFKEKNVNIWKNSIYSQYQNIAIHIRRPDDYDIILYEGSTNIERLNVSVDLYVTIIKQFIVSFPNCKIHIYSQKAKQKQISKNTNVIDEFEIYRSIDSSKVVLHIDEPLDNTFVEMVYADILVQAPSALSYIAGILSENTNYYFRYYAPPLPNWNIVSGYNGPTKYNFFLKNVDLSIHYDSITDEIKVLNIDKLRF